MSITNKKILIPLVLLILLILISGIIVAFNKGKQNNIEYEEGHFDTSVEEPQEPELGEFQVADDTDWGAPTESWEEFIKPAEPWLTIGAQNSLKTLTSDYNKIDWVSQTNFASQQGLVLSVTPLVDEETVRTSMQNLLTGRSTIVVGITNLYDYAVALDLNGEFIDIDGNPVGTIDIHSSLIGTGNTIIRTVDCVGCPYSTSLYSADVQRTTTTPAPYVANWEINSVDDEGNLILTYSIRSQDGKTMIPGEISFVILSEGGKVLYCAQDTLSVSGTEITGSLVLRDEHLALEFKDAAFLPSVAAQP